jgi:hypothetical protein
VAIAFVRNLSSGSSKSSASSIATAVMPATVPIGDTVVVVYIGSTTTSAVSSVTDTKGNVYTVLADVAGTTSRIAIAASVLTVQLTTSDTITVNLAAASGIRIVAAVEFSGLSLVQNVTAKSAAGTSGTPSTGASAATTNPNTLTFGLFGESNGTSSVTFTQGVGYTADITATTGTSGTNRTLQTEHQINTTTGAQTASATLVPTTLPWDALEVVLVESASIKSASDSASLTDAVAGTALSTSDSAALSEATGPTALTGTDSAALSEAVGPIALTGTDSATASETTGPTALSDVDSAVLSEAAGPVALSQSDSAALNEVTGPIALTQADSAVASEATGPTALADADVAAFAEALSLIATVSDFDNAVLSEQASVVVIGGGQPTAIYDSGGVPAPPRRRTPVDEEELVALTLALI